MRSRVDQQSARRPVRHAVGPDLGADAAETGRSGSNWAFAEPQRQQEVLRGQPAAVSISMIAASRCPATAPRASTTAAPRSPNRGVNATPPRRGRVTLRLMFSNVHCLPLRRSSTVRLPLLRPISRQVRPSSPLAPSRSIQASIAGEIGMSLRAAARARASAAASGAAARRVRIAGRKRAIGRRRW